MPARAAWLACAIALVFLLSLALLTWNVRATPVGSASIDPIAHVLAQDEAMYVNSAIRMSKDGDWLNPKLMGRLFLFKAPLLQWLSAISIQMLGLGLISIRLPSLLMGAAGVAAVFAWSGLSRRWPVALIAALLLISDAVWVTFSRLCFTDVLASTLALLAMLTLSLDPQMSRQRSQIVFGLLSGAAVLAKSVVGVLPFAALALYWLVMPRTARPRRIALLASLCVAAVIALPWPLYQLVTHPDWFWAEFVRFQIFAVGVTTATGVSGYPFFYLRRLAAMDPVLCTFVALALLPALRTIRARNPVQTVAVCWAGVVTGALLIFRGRSVSYLVLLVPALCILAALFLPRWLERAWIPLMLVLIAAFGIKASVGDLPYRGQSLESVAALRQYYSQNRDTELIIAAPDDSFYAITLPLPHVRYCYVDSSRAIAAFAPHYLELGIAVTPAQLTSLSDWMPELSRRLSQWRVKTQEPIATAILLPKTEDINIVARALPRADYDIPSAWEVQLNGEMRDTHSLHRLGERIFLLAHGIVLRPHPVRPLPEGW